MTTLDKVFESWQIGRVAEKKGNNMAEVYSPATEYKRIATTLREFNKQPFILPLKYRYWKLREFFGSNKAPIDTKLYPLLRTMRNLGGKEYVKQNLYLGKRFNVGEENEANAKTKIKNLFTEIKDQFNYLYNGDTSFVVTKLQREYDEHEEIRKQLLRLMPQFKTRINRFSRKHDLELIEFTEFIDHGENAKPIHKKMLDQMELPSFEWSPSVKSNKDNPTDKEKRRAAKRTMRPFSKGIAMFVALGQAVIGAYAVFEVVARVTFLLDPLWAPLLASIALVATLVTNYILFRNRTIKTMIQFFIDGKFFGDFGDEEIGSKIAAVFGFFTSLAAGIIMGAVAWIGCTALIPGAAGLSIGIGLMIFNVVSYTSVMYVSTINLIKKIREKLSIKYWFDENDGVFPKLEKRWRKNPFSTTLSWFFHLVLFAVGMAILVFSLTSLLSSWHHLVIQFLTDTLPAFMQVSTSVANIVSITLVLGLAGAARAAFNFESIFNVVDFFAESLTNTFVGGIKKILNIKEEKPPIVLKEEKFQFSDLWKDPLNTSLKWLEYALKGVLVALNSIAFSCLAVMGYHRLEILGISDPLAAKSLSLISTAIPSTGANGGAIRDALEPEPGIVFDSPIGGKNSLRRESQDALLDNLDTGAHPGY